MRAWRASAAARLSPPRLARRSSAGRSAPTDFELVELAGRPEAVEQAEVFALLCRLRFGELTCGSPEVRGQGLREYLRAGCGVRQLARSTLDGCRFRLVPAGPERGVDELRGERDELPAAVGADRGPDDRQHEAHDRAEQVVHVQRLRPAEEDSGLRGHRRGDDGLDVAGVDDPRDSRRRGVGQIDELEEVAQDDPRSARGTDAPWACPPSETPTA